MIKSFPELQLLAVAVPWASPGKQPWLRVSGCWYLLPQPQGDQGSTVRVRGARRVFHPPASGPTVLWLPLHQVGPPCT